MEHYDWLEIAAPDDYQQLEQYLDWEYAPAIISKQLQSQITEDVKFILIEHGYVDKDYRSTYYNFYAKKGRRYREDCLRLHFFDECVDFDNENTDLNCKYGNLADHYFGYVVLRPTMAATLGQSILSPNIRVGARGLTIQSRHRVHLLGYTLSIWGFPSMAQHIDIAVCAHVACWAILRHYSERFTQHQEFLLHEITRLANQFDPGGLVPSLGLDILQAERIFQAAGCFPLIVRKKSGCEPQFYAQLLAYLESGFPLFVAMHGHRHAIVVTGYAWHSIDPELPLENLNAWTQVDTLLGVDDNHLPYDCIRLRSVESSELITDGYAAEDFDAFIVPLPEKIHYPALVIESFSKGAFYSSHKKILKLPNKNRLILRYFITTVSALRRFGRENESQFGVELVSLLMRLKTAKFIWVVEYATISQWEQGHIEARAIIDATASSNDSVPIWLAHNSEIAIVYDRSLVGMESDASILDLNRLPNVPLARIELNLRPVINDGSLNRYD